MLSPWFLLFLVPFALFGYIAMILALTVYRFAPHGGDLQRRIHDLIVAKAELPAASRALDVGCGSGSLFVKFARASADSTVTGVDSWGRDWEYSKELCEDNARIEGSPPRRRVVGRRATCNTRQIGSTPAELLAVLVNELDYLGGRGSSSRAKKLAAALTISLARLSSRTSRSNSATRCASTVDIPGR